jgi:hypothetical protein
MYQPQRSSRAVEKYVESSAHFFAARIAGFAKALADLA